MIPRILHQTWKDESIPLEFRGYAESWRRFHPDWQFKLWTDDDLSELVRSRYPDLDAIFHAYPFPIMRADLGRYLVLREFGGVYADLDAEAVANFQPLLNAAEPIFAYEPLSHGKVDLVQSRDFDRIVSAAVILSPKGHEFWDLVLQLIRRCTTAKNPLDATGPFLLTAAIDRSPKSIAPRVLPAYVFAPFDKVGASGPQTESSLPVFAIHHWAGTWWKDTSSLELPSSSKDCDVEIDRPRPKPTKSFMTNEEVLAGLIRSQAEAESLRGTIDLSRLRPLSEKGGRVLVAIPVRDASDSIDQLTERLLRLAYPRSDLSIAFLEGDSVDDTRAKLQVFAQDYSAAFRKVRLLKRDTGFHFSGPRWAWELQRRRRGNLAAIRNDLVKEALDDEDWVLWIDADIIDFPDDVLTTLLGTGARIVHPNAVRKIGGESMDLNAWRTERRLSPFEMAPFIIDGFYQPPKGFDRLFLSDLRYKDRVPLDSVGGTMLLIDADLHRAGLLFPETPYRFLIETEGLGLLARDLGITPIGLPNLEILHSAR